MSVAEQSHAQLGRLQRRAGLAGGHRGAGGEKLEAYGSLPKGVIERGLHGVQLVILLGPGRSDASRECGLPSIQQKVV
jgi:hypothetical protein